MTDQEYKIIKELFERKSFIEKRQKILTEALMYHFSIYTDKQNEKIISNGGNGTAVEVRYERIVIEENGEVILKMLLEKYALELKEINNKIERL